MIRFPWYSRFWERNMWKKTPLFVDFPWKKQMFSRKKQISCSVLQVATVDALTLCSAGDALAQLFLQEPLRKYPDAAKQLRKGMIFRKSIGKWPYLEAREFGSIEKLYYGIFHREWYREFYRKVAIIWIQNDFRGEPEFLLAYDIIVNVICWPFWVLRGNIR